MVLQVEDPWASEFLKYREMGFSREEVGMALGALGSDTDQESQVLHTAPEPMFVGCMTSDVKSVAYIEPGAAMSD